MNLPERLGNYLLARNIAAIWADDSCMRRNAARLRPTSYASLVGQRHDAILRTFAPVHVDHHAMTVDITGLQVKRRLQARAAGAHGAQVGAVAQRANESQRRANRFAAQDGG